MQNIVLLLRRSGQYNLDPVPDPDPNPTLHPNYKSTPDSDPHHYPNSTSTTLLIISFHSINNNRNRK